MDKDKLIALLRNPKKNRQMSAERPLPCDNESNRTVLLVTGLVLILILMSLLFIFSAKYKAENIPSFIDDKVLKGLIVDRTFSPYKDKRYVQVSEGVERNVKVKELGSTLPVISRHNFRALNKESYEIIGTAPWALSVNIESNAEDPDLLRYLFSQDDMIQAFLKRRDVAPLLEDYTALEKMAENETALQKFFNQNAAKQILASDELLKTFANSRFMAYLLVSQSAKHYRDNPKAAAELIRKSPTLSALKQNPAVRKAISENDYLKNIAPTLLK